MVMRKSTTSKLVTLLTAGALANATIGDEPEASVEFEKSVLLPGQSSFFDVRLDTLTGYFTKEVKGLSYYLDPFPEAVHVDPNSSFYNVFADPNQGIFTDGFFYEHPVDWGLTVINQTNGGVHQTLAPPFVFQRDDKVVRYFFNVPQNTPTNQDYTVRLYSINLTVMDPFPQDYEIPSNGGQLIPGSVRIVPDNPADFNKDGYINFQDAQFFMTNMNGVGYSSPADIDGDGSATMTDFARLQRCFTGTEPVGSPDCGD
jgi:hypothetical protein